MVETLHQEVSKPRQLLDRTEVARGLNPRKKRRKGSRRDIGSHDDRRSGISMVKISESIWAIHLLSRGSAFRES
jgi:hypothetical protein